MQIGYTGISTGEQTLDLQRDALTAVGCDRILEEVGSVAKADRPGLEETLLWIFHTEGRRPGWLAPRSTGAIAEASHRARCDAKSAGNRVPKSH